MMETLRRDSKVWVRVNTGWQYTGSLLHDTSDIYAATVVRVNRQSVTVRSWLGIVSRRDPRDLTVMRPDEIKELCEEFAERGKVWI